MNDAQACCACLTVKYDPEDVETYVEEFGKNIPAKRERWTCAAGCGSNFVRKAAADYKIERLNAEIEQLTGERDRQYDYNVEQIAKQAALEAEIEQLTNREHEVFRAGWEAGYGGTDKFGVNEGCCDDDYEQWLQTTKYKCPRCNTEYTGEHYCATGPTLSNLPDTE